MQSLFSVVPPNSLQNLQTAILRFRTPFNVSSHAKDVTSLLYDAVDYIISGKKNKLPSIDPGGVGRREEPSTEAKLSILIVQLTIPCREPGLKPTDVMSPKSAAKSADLWHEACRSVDDLVSRQLQGTGIRVRLAIQIYFIDEDSDYNATVEDCESFFPLARDRGILRFLKQGDGIYDPFQGGFIKHCFLASMYNINLSVGYVRLLDDRG
jgi:hypothetical protein